MSVDVLSTILMQMLSARVDTLSQRLHHTTANISRTKASDLPCLPVGIHIQVLPDEAQQVPG